MGNSTSSNLKKEIGMHVLVMLIGVILIISGALGVTMYNTMATPTSVNEGVIASNINITFITWMVVGILFVFLYSMIWVNESALKKCETLKDNNTSNFAEKLKNMKISTTTMVYLVGAILITTCSEGIALHGMIKTYKGLVDSKGDSQDSQKTNRDLATSIYNAFIVFLALDILLLVVYTVYTFKLLKNFQ